MAIYLDYNATTPVDEEVQEVISNALKIAWHNPSSSHGIGETARLMIADARRQLSEMISCNPDEIIFTSGGTESNNMVIHSAIHTFYSERQKGGKLADDERPHIITTNIEHDSIKLPLEKLASEGKCDVSFVAVSTETGMVSVDDILAEITPNTCLITVMLANNETGIIQPVHLLRRRLHDWEKNSEKSSNSILLHTDAAQAIGKMEVNLIFCNVDYVTIVGHKFYGPRIGALYFKRNKPLFPMFYGGGQERAYRPGTENTCMIAGLGAAAELVTSNLERYIDDMERIKGYLQEKLEETFPKRLVFHGRGNVLPNTLSVAFDYEGVTGAGILSAAPEVCASTGAACHSSTQPSSVLIASGVSADLASKTLRLSVGRETNRRDIDKAVECLHNALLKICKVAL